MVIPEEYMVYVFIGFLVVWFVGICAMPLVVIWALNTLLGLHIVYSFWTWLAGAIILGLLTTKISLKGV